MGNSVILEGYKGNLLVTEQYWWVTEGHMGIIFGYSILRGTYSLQVTDLGT